MTKERITLIKFLIIFLIIGTGYFLKGLPMAVALAIGIFIIFKFKRRAPEEYQEDDITNND